MQAVKLHPINDKSSLVREYARNKAQADSLVDRNREIARILLGMVDIPKDAKSAQFVAGGYKVTLTPKENVRWDQDALDAAFQRLGDTFLKPFKYEWKPRSAKALGAFMEYAPADQVAAIKAAMSVSSGQPGVKLESMED